MTTHSILDDSFCYVPAIATSVAETWRRFGWRPTTEEERKRRRKRITAQTSQVIVGHFGHDDQPTMPLPLHSERREAQPLFPEENPWTSPR